MDKLKHIVVLWLCMAINIAAVVNPSYLGLELILLACALQARTWACFAVALVPSTLALLYRIHVEETALRLAF
jgi:protein-S-isoprenylcysteine O-methyltransferase Ste14